jgi:hypothetical protein
MYIALAGENCFFSDAAIHKSEEVIGPDYIPRISPIISFIDGPSGDLPNVQIDGYRNDSTEGIPITDGLKLQFHAMFLPAARLVWHCPYISLFYSDDRLINGENYFEYALIRLDGEQWDSSDGAQNRLIVNLTEDFEGWDAWKENGKKGFECTVTFKREDNKITTTTENLGIKIINVTTLNCHPKEVYVSLTGDQVALTNIRII